jgi:tRNA modification GTPase
MLSDPIAALATPPGRSAIAVVRLDGVGALAVAERVVRGFAAAPPRRSTLATFVALDGSTIDRGLYTVFPAPHSYTGHDLVELSTHGGVLAPARLLAALYAAGARPAAPGEFTRRAVLNGRLDLVQAEGVGDLIDATAARQAQAALQQIEGGLSRRLLALREALVEVQALLSYEIDFPDEDEGPVRPERVAEALGSVAAQIDRLLASAPAGERLREGALVVLAGRPNAGKSSLFNALLGVERALVTEIAGTTRDAIEAHTEIEGWPVRLVDTAGLWDAPERIDRLGIEVSRRYLKHADLVLLCVEADRRLEPDEAEIVARFPSLVVRTKADLAVGSVQYGVAVSAMTGQGVDAVRTQLAQRAFAGGSNFADLEPFLSRERHRLALERARSALDDARPHLGTGRDAVLGSHHVREAMLALDELIGGVDIDDVLDRVFSSFCIGK